MLKCRCGYEGVGDHPCHAKLYTCRKSAEQRFYNPKIVSLAGIQMKLEVTDTWACNECWEEYEKSTKL